MKSLLLRVKGIAGSVELWLSVSLPTGLKTNLGLFWFFLSMMNNRRFRHFGEPSWKLIDYISRLGENRWNATSFPTCTMCVSNIFILLYLIKFRHYFLQPNNFLAAHSTAGAVNGGRNEGKYLFSSVFDKARKHILVPKINFCSPLPAPWPCTHLPLIPAPSLPASPYLWLHEAPRWPPLWQRTMPLGSPTHSQRRTGCFLAF